MKGQADKRPPLLEVRDLSLGFRDRLALDRVSLRISAGRTLGLVGPSGAGKSSIARAIMRLAPVESGEILLNGENVLSMGPRQLRAARRRMQLVFQDPSASLSPRRTVEQTLLEPLEHFAIGEPSSRRARVREALHTVGIEAAALRRYPHQFSAGQQQRIAIARALVSGPELLIADEAVSALDVSVQAQILQLIQSLQAGRGIGFLFISHDLAVIRQIADDVAVIYRGQLLEQSPADVFFQAPAHPYSRSLLDLALGRPPSASGAQTWTLERAAPRDARPPGCVFAGFCPDEMPACAHREPGSHTVQGKNRHATGLHCVKCHLYDRTG